MGKKTKNIVRKKKINLVFDVDKRKEFLCGFRKRKLERKKKAQEELKQMLKDEKKRIKQENKESYKKLVLSSKPIPDLEQILQEEYEDDDVNVKIVELSTDTLQKQNLCIGDNKPVERVIGCTNEKKTKTSVLPGMDLEVETDDINGSSSKPEQGNESLGKTKKEIKQMLKRQATKKLQKSKVFQMKSKLDRIQNKKKSHNKKQTHDKVKPHVAKKKEKGKKNFGRKKH